MRLPLVVATLVALLVPRAPVASADTLLLKDGRTVENVKIAKEEGGYRLTFKNGDVLVPAAGVKEVFVEGAAGYEPKDDEERAKVAKGLVPYEGRWIPKADRDAQVARKAAAAKKRIDEAKAHRLWRNRYKEKTANFDFEYTIPPEIAKGYIDLMEAYYAYFTKAFDCRRNPKQRLTVCFYHDYDTFLDVSGEALDLELNKDGTRLAAALAEYGNQGALFNTTTGSKMFRQRCGGDAQAVAIAGDNWYTGYHEECEGDFTIRLVGNSMLTGARQTDWLPAFDRFWGVRDLATDGRVLVVAGDFTSVAGVPAQGFTIFPAAPPPAPPPVSLPANATWRYLDSGVLEPGWSDPTFDDTTWAQGPAQLGYGDGDEATVISYGPNANQKYVTSWFRTSFLATAVPATLTLDLVADDGAVVYLNGVEVLRDNVGPGDDVAALRAASGRSGTAENAVRSFVLPPELVTAGINTIAVSVHQDLPTSSDLSFSAALRSTAAG